MAPRARAAAPPVRARARARAQDVPPTPFRGARRPSGAPQTTRVEPRLPTNAPPPKQTPHTARANSPAAERSRARASATGHAPTRRTTLVVLALPPRGARARASYTSAHADRRASARARAARAEPASPATRPPPPRYRARRPRGTGRGAAAAALARLRAPRRATSTRCARSQWYATCFMIIGRVPLAQGGHRRRSSRAVIIPARVATAFEAALLGAQALRGARRARSRAPAGVSMVLLMAALLLVMAPEFAARRRRAARVRGRDAVDVGGRAARARSRWPSSTQLRARAARRAALVRRGRRASPRVMNFAPRSSRTRSSRCRRSCSIFATLGAPAGARPRARRARRRRSAR